MLCILLWNEEERDVALYCLYYFTPYHHFIYFFMNIHKLPHTPLPPFPLQLHKVSLADQPIWRDAFLSYILPQMATSLVTANPPVDPSVWNTAIDLVAKISYVSALELATIATFIHPASSRLWQRRLDYLHRVRESLTSEERRARDTAAGGKNSRGRRVTEMDILKVETRRRGIDNLTFKE